MQEPAQETIARRIADTFGLPRRKTEKVLQLYRKILHRELKATGTVWLPGLGTITVRRRRAPIGYTRKRAFKIASFRLSKAMK